VPAVTDFCESAKRLGVDVAALLRLATEAEAEVSKTLSRVEVEAMDRELKALRGRLNNHDPCPPTA
jgi:post-segregation antitoxin (ccd killing protein)